MSDDIPGIISHVSLGTRDMARALAFYDPVMSTIGATRKEVVELEDGDVVAVAYGRENPEFWIQIPDNSQLADVGNGIHIAFMAHSQESVNSFHEVAIQHGGTDNGAPGPRPHYGDEYYGCFLLDPDGNRIEATFLNVSKSV